MMAGEFWLSEAQWGAIGPLLPKNQPGARRTDDRRVISGVVHVSEDRLSVAGFALPSTGLRRRSTIAFAAGRCAAFGAACLTRWCAPIPAMVKPSTARRPRLTARRRAEKGGGGAGDWPFARRPRHENPRHRRRARTPHRHRSDAWPSRRRSSRDSLDHRSSGRRLLGCRRRLRQRWSASLSSPARHGSGHPEQSDPQETSSFRRDSLSPTQSHRAHVLPPQGLETPSPHATTSSQPPLPPPS